MNKIVVIVIISFMAFSTGIIADKMYFGEQISTNPQGTAETNSHNQPSTQYVSNYSNSSIPTSLEELKADLESVGCTNILVMEGSELFQGVRVISYNDALKLASKARFVMVIGQGTGLALLIPIEGERYYWVSVDSSQYTRFEKIELSSAYCDTSTATYNLTSKVACWNITLVLRNTGTTEASIIAAFVNSKAIADYGTDSGGPALIDDNIRAYNTSITRQLNFAQVSGSANIKMSIKPGVSDKIFVCIRQPLSYESWAKLSSGTTIEVSVSTAAGNSYMKMITLT
jgi:hypothetical protein